jgi:hypothetical protein
MKGTDLEDLIRVKDIPPLEELGEVPDDQYLHRQRYKVRVE